MQLDLYSSAPVANQLQPLSSFLTQRKVFITIDDAIEYKRCRVQSNRKGIVLRDLVKGAAVNTKKQQVCQPGDFIVAEIDAKVGGYGFIPTELDGAIVSSHYYLFEVDENQLLPRYLYYLTQSDIIQSQISSQGSTNYAAIRPKEFLAIEIPYVELEQQRELVARLDALTQEAEGLNQEFAHQATLLARLRQAVLREAVQGCLVPQEATDEPATALLARIRAEKQRLVKEKKLRPNKPLPPLTEMEVPYEVPQGWAWCRLGEVSQKTEYGTSQKADSSSTNVPVLRMNNIINGKIIYDKLKYVSSTIEDLPKLYLKQNDLLFNRTNSVELVGKTGLYTGNDDKMTFASYLIRIVFFDSISAEFCNYYINSNFCRESQILPRVTQQNGQANFNGTKLQEILIPLPPLAEQRRIVAKVAELLAHYAALEAELLRARQAAEALHTVALREAFTNPINLTLSA